MFSLKSKRIGAIMAIMVTLCGCGPTPPSLHDGWSTMSQTTPETAQYYLQRAHDADPETRDQWLSYAALKLCNEAHLRLAKHIANQPLASPTTSENRALRAYARGKLAAYQQRRGMARRWIQQALPHLPPVFVAEAYSLKALLASQSHHPRQALQALSQAYQHLPTAAQADFVAQHWQQLAASGVTMMDPLAQHIPPTLMGWTQLAQLTQQALHTPNLWQPGLLAWQQRWPHHPAQNFLSPLPPSAAIHNIGVMLPQHGLYGEQGNSILYGVMASLYQIKKQHPNQTFNIVVFDTSPDNNDAMQAFVARPDIDAIIGPLRKERVQVVQSLHLQKPILAFNPPQDGNLSGHLSFMDFTQNAEMADLGQHIHALGYQRPLILAQSTPLGDKLSHAFLAHWPTPLDIDTHQCHLPLDAKQNNSTIKQAMGIVESQQHADIVAKVLGQKLRTIPSHRPDIDAIVLAMNHKKAQQIIPLVRYYYGGNLPMFGASILQRHQPSRYQNQDLEHVRYLDYLPANASRQPDHKIPKWPKYLRNHPTFFRMGQDSLMLLRGLPILQALPLAQYRGQSGIYQMRSAHRLTRHRQWLTVHRGRPQRAHSPWALP